MFLFSPEAPSKVVNLTSSQAGNEFNMTWVKPETPNGPINGYIVKISDKTNKEDSEIDIADANPSYSFNEIKSCTE